MNWKKTSQGRPERRKLPLDNVTVEALLGHFVINWNNLETTCRHVLILLCGRPPAIQAVTSNLNGENLYYALRAAAPESVAPEIAQNVEALAECLNRLNAHRNYYVHGAKNVAGITGKEELKIRSEYSRGALRVFEDSIDKRELSEISGDCAEIAMEAFEIYCYLELKKMGQDPDLPEMPFLPPKLEKSQLK